MSKASAEAAQTAGVWFEYLSWDHVSGIVVPALTEVLTFPHWPLSTDAWASSQHGAWGSSGIFPRREGGNSDYLKAKPSKLHSDSHHILLVEASHRARQRENRFHFLM